LRASHNNRYSRLRRRRGQHIDLLKSSLRR
jgi:hypothetical protein